MALSLGLLCLFSSVDLLFAKDEAVVFIVDPYWDDVASYVAHVPLLKEYRIFKVMTHLGELPSLNSDHADVFTYSSRTANDSMAAKEICPKLRSMGVPIAAVIPTSDPTVALTDLLAACVGARGNPSDGPLAMARRDKWAMGEAVRKAGLRSVKEKLVSTWDQAKEYIETLNPPLSHANPVIFKILEGAGSQGVTPIYSLKQAEEVLSSEIGSKSQFGDHIAKILIQEDLKGKEYVIDSVSRDGVHKVVVVWCEDLRPSNGIFDQYFGFKVMDPNDPLTMVIIDYANKVLDATGLQNGAADMEIMFLEEEGAPCLVEINARWTGLTWDNGLAFEKAIVGQDQVTATINAYLDGDAFNEMPPVLPIAQHAAIVFLTNHHAGILRGIPGLAAAKKFPSYLSSNNQGAFVGKLLEKTGAYAPIHIFLANREQAVVDADYDRIIDLENSDAFFDITPSTGYTSLTALRASDGGSPGHWLAAIAALVALTVATVLGLAALSRRNVRDGTEYLTLT